MENTIQTLKWDSDDCVRFNIDESEIGDSVFNEDNLPWRLWDAAHENKNLPRKIHDVSKCNSFSFIVFFFKNLNSVISVKAAGCNGNIRGLGNKNRLYLTIFVQQTILAFHHMDESKQTKRPLDWIQRVDAMLSHFRGDHTACDCLERSVITFSFENCHHHKVTNIKLSPTSRYKYCVGVITQKFNDLQFSSSCLTFRTKRDPRI